MSNYQDILTFLKEYGGKQYRKKEKRSPGEESDLMEQGEVAGKRARSLFEEIIFAIEKQLGLSHDRITQWQNSGTFASYFWCQMKDKSRTGSPISLSLFAEKVGMNCRFRGSVELAVDKASDRDHQAYNEILKKELSPGLVYVVGGNNELVLKIVTDKKEITASNNNAKRTQVSFIVDEGTFNNDELINKLVDGFSKLLPYYEAAFKKNSRTKASAEQESKKSDHRMKDSKAKKIFNVREVIGRVCEYIDAKGFSYPNGAIENFYLSIKSKPFVILAGTSGTGKTKLVKLFAEAIGATSAEGGNGRYKLVSVRPDWSDSSDLFGHVNLKGEFIPGAIIGFIDRAIHDTENPYFLCLDEMNLARVEYYLSDFLSLMETRRKDNGKIITDGVVLDEAAKEKFEEIYLPENLYIIGTVNMDETTFPFSKKVLDRANTIEFNYVDLIPKFDSVGTDVEGIQVKNDFLRAEYLTLARDCSTEKTYVKKLCEKLQELNSILGKANAHVGYRVRDEIVFYMLNNKKAGFLLPEEQAFDNEIMQKILPRIQGDSEAIKSLLVELFKFCMNNKAGIDADTGHVGEYMRSVASKAKYPASATKIGYMMMRYEEDGFTSYWL